MRHAIRIQPYLSRDLFQQLRAYAAAHSSTVSAVVADALGEYLKRDDVDEDLLARRLDDVTHAVEQLGGDLNALAVGFGKFAENSFVSTPLAPEDKAVRRAQALYRSFLSKVAAQIRAGTTFTGQVFPTRQPLAVPPVPANTEKGGRDEGGRS
jgi:hypothetical protein